MFTVLLAILYLNIKSKSKEVDNLVDRLMGEWEVLTFNRDQIGENFGRTLNVYGKTGDAKNIDEFAHYTLKIFNNNQIWEELRSNLFKLRGKLSWEKSSKKFLNTLKK